MKSVFRWGWLALAAALVCLPAHAQSCTGDVEADCYSTIDIDGAGNITGASVTILPYWYGMFDLEAYAEGLLEGPSSEIEDVDAYDDEEGYAEADTSGTALVTGDYVQYGYHWVLDPYDGLADSEIGETDTDDEYTAYSCLVPDGEYTTYTGEIADPAYGAYGAFFYATLTPIPSYYFAATMVWENVTYNGDQCYYVGSPEGPFEGSSTGDAMWTVDNTGDYGDDQIGVKNLGFYGANYYQFQIANGLDPGVTSCNFFADTQKMYHSCTGQVYQTNALVFQIDAYHMTASRDGVWAYVE